MGFAAAKQFLGGRAIGYGDCRNVVRDATAAQELQTSARRRYAGILRTSMGYRGHDHIVEVNWTKGHVRDKLSASDFVALGEHDQWMANRNDDADRAADKGRLMHPQPERGVLADTEMLVEDLTGLFKMAAATLRLWPRLPGNLDRLPSGRAAAPRQPRPPPAKPHRWGRLVRGWLRCSVCWRATRPHLAARHEECRGTPRVAAETHESHDLRGFTVGGEAVFVCFWLWRIRH